MKVSGGMEMFIKETDENHIFSSKMSILLNMSIFEKACINAETYWLKLVVCMEIPVFGKHCESHSINVETYWARIVLKSIVDIIYLEHKHTKTV